MPSAMTIFRNRCYSELSRRIRALLVLLLLLLTTSLLCQLKMLHVNMLGFTIRKKITQNLARQANSRDTVPPSFGRPSVQSQIRDPAPELVEEYGHFQRDFKPDVNNRETVALRLKIHDEKTKQVEESDNFRRISKPLKSSHTVKNYKDRLLQSHRQEMTRSFDILKPIAARIKIRRKKKIPSRIRRKNKNPSRIFNGDVIFNGFRANLTSDESSGALLCLEHPQRLRKSRAFTSLRHFL